MLAPHMRLAVSASTISLIFAAGLSTAAQAQDKPKADDTAIVEEVVVTGTSIRGAAPVGSALVAVGRQDIEKTSATTVQQILKTVPSVTGLGSAGQGSFGSADNSGTNAPTIHGLGASASNSTLILIDGHRIPLTGINHALSDPNIIAPGAIERVEVLADGASSVYGSDAVAGVINFITRRNYDGFEVSAQTGFADNYKTYSGSLLWGKRWDGGSALFSYGYSDRSNLRAGDRDFTHADHRSQGGTNLASFNCGTASVQPAGSSLIYAAPYTGAGVTNAAANAFCDYSGVADLLPSERRHSVIAKVSQDFGEKLTVGADVIYSKRNNFAALSRGTITTTVYGPGSGKGSQINPFYVNPTGSTATSQTIRLDANDLLGPGAYADSGATSFLVNGQAEYKLDDNFILTVGGTAGQDESREQRVGVLCSSCANLALNGTTNGSGSLTAASIPGTTVVVTQGLTTANALDVWHSGANNLTSAAVKAALKDSTTTQIATQTLENARAKIDGTLFALPGGDVRIAFGGEYSHYTLKQDLTRPLNIGPATLGSATVNLNYDRVVKSGYVELLVPIIGEGNALPFVQALDLNLSGRYDNYSDFGSTKNPKIAVNWKMTDSVKFRANWAKSFVAPAFTSIGSGGGITGESGFGNYGQGTVNVPIAAYANATQLPGCAAATTTCTIGTTITGAQISGGNDQLQPQHGKSWAAGVDFNPSFLPGFRGSVTYWSSKLTGGITAPTPAFAVNSAGLNGLLKIYPNGATPAEIAAAMGNLPLTSALPSTVYFIYDFRQRNALNLDIAGLDIDASYRFNTDNLGSFNIGGSISEKLKFDQNVGGGTSFDVLNTTGFNTTFPSVKRTARANVGWTMGQWSADAFVNYTGSYYNWSGTTQTAITRNAAGVPTGGGDKVKAYTTLDLHLAYDIKSDGFLGGVQLFGDVSNAFDKDPPFYNNANGYDTFSGNPIGRIIAVGFRAKY